MADETTNRESPSPSLAAIDALPDDPEVLKALLREQAEALEALTLQVAAMAPSESEGELWHERLLHFQRLHTLGVLAGGIAHEFNNILAAMLGFTEITWPLVPPDSPAQHNLQEVYSAGQRARGVIRQTLNYSRSTSAVTEPLPYAPLVKDILGLLRVSLSKTIDIHEAIADDAGDVLADPAGLHQILMNLCINAAHALGNSGRIEVVVEPCQADDALLAQHPQLQPGDYIRLCVQDDGHGMAPEVLDRIFEPFFSTKTTAQGAGLGLSIVNRLVSAYGGAIAVQSAPDAGAVFTVYLPRAAAPAAAPKAAPFGPRGKGNILLIDDEAMLAQLGQRLLQRLGYHVEGLHPSQGGAGPLSPGAAAFRSRHHRSHHARDERRATDQHPAGHTARPTGAVVHRLWPYAGRRGAGGLGRRSAVAQADRDAGVGQVCAGGLAAAGRELLMRSLTPPAAGRAGRRAVRQWARYAQSAPGKFASRR